MGRAMRGCDLDYVEMGMLYAGGSEILWRQIKMASVKPVLGEGGDKIGVKNCIYILNK